MDPRVFLGRGCQAAKDPVDEDEKSTSPDGSPSSIPRDSEKSFVLGDTRQTVLRSGGERGLERTTVAFCIFIFCDSMDAVGRGGG